ncbi:MAG: GNAT superfamily N-acetyltransferase [Natronomonas sp.]|jgi:GNAT superfamily N-acetyltransferase|uniref:GNAT family N-acetyltransferase n=1 Tax=Natronomonas sp. TaxID=2184060 RepID=UPI0039892610
MYKGHFPKLGHRWGLKHPPLRFEDGDGRAIDIHPYGNGPIGDEYEALVEMYLDFDPRHRSLGIPPTEASQIREWLDRILEDYCVLAWHGDQPIGQAVLIEDDPGRHELAIFLHQAYHGAGIGTHLLEATLGYGKRHGISHVWLLVERENRPAVNLYNDVGFAVVNDFGHDLEMALTL